MCNFGIVANAFTAGQNFQSIKLYYGLHVPTYYLGLYVINGFGFSKFCNYSCLGISNDSHIITYDYDDDFGVFSSPRVWWMFRYFGHEAISVLNGGFRTWLNAGLRVESGQQKPARSKCSSRSKN